MLFNIATNRYIIKNKFILNIWSIILFVVMLVCFAGLSTNGYATTCLIPIPGKAGCIGISKLSDIKYKEHTKCFKIDKNAKDCGVFIGVLPTDMGTTYRDVIGGLDCKSLEVRNNPECVNYCYNNPDASSSACVNCNSLDDEEKSKYSYCQDPDDAKYCEEVLDDGNGSSWPRTLGGVTNVTGICLKGYILDSLNGAPTRDCLSSGV